LKTSCEDLGVVFRYGRGVYSKLEEAAQPELIGSGYRPSALLRSTNSFNLAGLQGRLEISSTLKWEMLAGRWYPWAIAGTGLVLGSLLSVWMVEQVRQRQARTEEAIELRSAHAALSAVREVREEVTRELHDNALQNLYALGLELNKGRAQIELAPNEAARSLERGLGEVRRISDDLRRFLSPAKEIGDKATGQAALGSIAERFAHSTGMTVRLRLESEVAKRLSPETIVELAQVMCECLANAHRHGKARKVEVVLVGAGPDGWTFRIQDDGSGFDPQAAKPSPGFGLRNLQQRAVLLGAHLFLDSNSGSGTTVELHYPDSTFTPESGLRQ
jgi:signal transduction histidine kinase